MSTPADKIKYLNETKAAIKEAIKAKGVVVADDATFRSYADSIEAITGPLPQQEKTIEITANGSYEVTPDEGYVISKAVANINIPIPEPIIEALEITENGTYEAAAGIDGYSPITVNVPTGGGGAEVEPIVLTGSGQYACAGKLSGAYITLFGDTISTSNISSCLNMFNGNTAEIIPFDINCSATNYNFGSMFYNCTNLKTLPKINIVGVPTIPTSSYSFLTIDDMFIYCNNLREIPEDFFPFDVYPEEYWEARKTLKVSGVCPFSSGCLSLRRMPSNILRYCLNYGTSIYSSIYNALGSQCYVLDEILNLPVEETTYTSNAFQNFFSSSHRLKNVTFETNEDGSAKTANWKGQSINLSSIMGYSNAIGPIINYNSGITADKEVKDDATYQALKNDPDWFTLNDVYSRYNHDSAVATINSLPDTSAYIAANGGTNTIKFRGANGSATDGGAINTLTEEEIAVAAAKGWTVSLV
jgi:hypothetical protein